ncbi:MAG: hypothetical protein VKJ02_16020 [Snowella sp.]|nr:hypothetical protein [Snowella sp.]
MKTSIPQDSDSSSCSGEVTPGKPFKWQNAKLISFGVTPTGYISIGIVPMGVIAIGVVPMGVISIGAVAMGAIAAGFVSMGMVAFGGVSMSNLTGHQGGHKATPTSAPVVTPETKPHSHDSHNH